MSNRGNPLLSVIIPTREHAKTLRYTLRTALDQTSENFEVIVMSYCVSVADQSQKSNGGIIRQQIRRYHPFDVSRFLLYSAFHQSLALRKRMLSRILTLCGLAKYPPDNIRDFVNVLSGSPIRQ